MMTAKIWMCWLGIATLLVFLAGCGDAPDTAGPQTETTAKDVKAQAAQTVESVREYTRQQMDDYQEQVEEQLKEFDQKLGEMKSEMASLQLEAKEHYYKTLAALQQKQMEARATLKGLERESGEAWSRMKQRLDEMVGELASAFDQADTSA